MESTINEIKFEGHKYSNRYPYSLIKIDQNTIACSMEDSIKIWTLSNMRTPLTISNENHAGNSFIQLEDGRLVAGSGLEIHLFEPITYTLVCALKGHKDIILCLFQLKDSRLMSSSLDATFKIWNITNHQCQLTIKGIDKISKCLLQLNDNNIVSCSCFRTIKIWDPRQFHSLIVINKKGYSLLQLTNGNLAIGLFQSIEIWNINTISCIFKLAKNMTGAVVCLLELKENYFASCSDNVIQIWSSTYHYIKRIELNIQSIVNAIYFDVCQIAMIDHERIPTCIDISKWYNHINSF